MIEQPTGSEISGRVAGVLLAAAAGWFWAAAVSVSFDVQDNMMAFVPAITVCLRLGSGRRGSKAVHFAQMRDGYPMF